MKDENSPGVLFQKHPTLMIMCFPRLAQIEDDDSIDECWFFKYIGGDVDAGLAIAEMTYSMSIPVVSLVLEAAIPLAYHWPYPPAIPSLYSGP